MQKGEDRIKKGDAAEIEKHTDEKKGESKEGDPAEIRREIERSRRQRKKPKHLKVHVYLSRFLCLVSLLFYRKRKWSSWLRSPLPSHGIHHGNFELENKAVGLWKSATFLSPSVKTLVALSRTSNESPKGCCSHVVTSLPIKFVYAKKKKE